jgi:hypothetical protein
LDLERRANSFLYLASRIRNLSPAFRRELYQKAAQGNPWYIKENLDLALEGLLVYLSKSDLLKWLQRYNIADLRLQKVGVVMAGNIPMVGVHDMICVLLSGNHLFAKTSKQDDVLIRFIASELIDIAPDFSKRITFVEHLRDIDAVIATGSNNTSRYFEYYFANTPHIIRKNRTSVAVLNGFETDSDLQGLGVDIFTHFGLGCRNVSKLFLPKGYDIRPMVSYWKSFRSQIQHSKYRNNYGYQRAIMLMNKVPHEDNGLILMRESKELISPIGVLYYEHYNDAQELQSRLASIANQVQCVVTNEPLVGKVAFGEAQLPAIDSYADGIDTMEFLARL